jgi:lipoprotein NlpD
VTDIVLRIGSSIAVLTTVLSLVACGSTGQSAPVVDRTPAPVVTPPVESRTSRTEREPVSSPPAKTATTEPVAQTNNTSLQQKPATPAPPRQADEPAGADWRPQFYTVRKGDTLYSIALDFGQDYRDLAAWNGLADAAYIRVGQKLRLFAAPGTAATAEGAPSTQVVPTLSEPKGYRSFYSDDALAAMQRQARAAAAGSDQGAATQAVPAADKPAGNAGRTAATASPAGTNNGRLSWEWPAPGELLYEFSKGPIKKGVVIGGQPGQAIVSSAPGKVVYSGSGLRGYGNLIIVKHNDTYLSVYAHNSQLLVSEGQMVAQGQKIAVMGEIPGGSTGLHFEIRRLGKPVNPLTHLPDKPS